MKKLFALFCVFAMTVSICGCSTTTTETTVTSSFDDLQTDTSTNENLGDSKVDGSSNSNSNSGSEIATGSNSKIDNPLNVDLKGAKIVIYDTESIFQGDDNSKSEMVRSDIIKKVQKELNCKLVVNEVTSDKLKTLAATSASAGKAIGGIITSDIYFSGTYIASNLVADLKKISSMDLSKDYMNIADVVTASQFGNGQYAIGCEALMTTYCTFYNKRILGELGYGENYLYDLVDKGKWTITEYRNLSKKAMKDLDGKSGMSRQDQWGQVNQDAASGITANIVVSMGTSKVKLVDGKLKLNMTDPKILEAVDLSRDVIMKDGTADYDLRGDAAVNFFANGNSLFLYAFGSKASYLTKMKDEFGVLPAPKVDGAKDYSSANDGNAGVIMIPAGLSAKDQYNAGAVVQAFMYLYQKEVIPAQKQEYINRYLCDEKSGDNWLLASSCVTTQPVQCYSRISEEILTGTDRVFWNAIEKDKSAAESIESTKVATQKALDDLNVKIKDK